MSASLLLRPSRPRRPVAAADAAPQLFLTVRETAALLRTTRKAVYAMAERGLLPGVVRIGRRVLVERETLIRSLREGCAPSAARR